MCEGPFFPCAFCSHGNGAVSRLRNLLKANQLAEILSGEFKAEGDRQFYAFSLHR